MCFWNPWKSPTVPHGSTEHTFDITDLNDIKIQLLPHTNHAMPQFKSSPS
jgi:hypothetical protein